MSRLSQLLARLAGRQQSEPGEMSTLNPGSPTSTALSVSPGTQRSVASMHATDTSSRISDTIDQSAERNVAIVEEVLSGREVLQDVMPPHFGSIHQLAILAILFDELQAIDESTALCEKVIYYGHLFASVPSMPPFWPSYWQWSEMLPNIKAEHHSDSQIVTDRKQRVRQRILMSFYSTWQTNNAEFHPVHTHMLRLRVRMLDTSSEVLRKANFLEVSGQQETPPSADIKDLLRDLKRLNRTDRERLREHASSSSRSKFPTQSTDVCLQSERLAQVQTLARRIPAKWTISLQVIMHWCMEQTDFRNLRQGSLDEALCGFKCANITASDATSIARRISLCLIFIAWWRLRKRATTGLEISTFETRTLQELNFMMSEAALCEVEVFSLVATIIHPDTGLPPPDLSHILDSMFSSPTDLGAALARRWLQSWIWIDHDNTRKSAMYISDNDLAKQTTACVRALILRYCEQRRSNRSNLKLRKLSKSQLAELTTDVTDELQRRHVSEHIRPCMLQMTTDFHAKRNQARQRLAELKTPRFLDLVLDTLHENERRRLQDGASAVDDV